jgi:membrane protein DedA with SNARE-associated domain/rhodanese-related sulfurtransferase
MIGATQLTYSGIALAVFGEQFCLPVPAVLLLMTAGALIGQGQGSLRLGLVLLSSVIGCLIADGIWFWLGRRWGSGVLRLVCSLTSDPRGSRERSRRIFARWGLRLLLVAKFVPVLDGVSPPLAGTEGASVGGFLAYDTVGAFLWSAAYVTIGFMFSRQLDSVTHLLDRFGTVLALVVGLPVLAYAAWRLLYLVRMIRHLRLRRISPAMLQRRLDDGEKVAIVDLLHFQAAAEIPGIPGAVRIDPKRLHRAKRIIVPEDVQIVLYCSSKNEFTSARVANALHKIGVADVWVLEGGLEAWAEEGRSVTTKLFTSEEAAQRMGIQITMSGK